MPKCRLNRLTDQMKSYVVSSRKMMLQNIKRHFGALLRDEGARNQTNTASVRKPGAWLKTWWINSYLLFLLFLLIYTWIMQEYGGLPALLPAWRLEIPLLLYLYCYFNAITHRSRWQPLVTAIPIVLLYGVFDVYHLQLGRLLRVTEVTELPEMLRITPIWVTIFLGLLFGLPTLAFLRFLRFRRFHVMALGALPLVSLVLTAEFAPDFFITVFEKTQKPIVTYSDIMSAANNGRFGMTLYNEAKRKSFVRKIAHYKGNSLFVKEFDEVVARLNSQKIKNNVHLIVLESFFDPELLRGTTFSPKPTHPSFEKIFKNKGSLSVSPVFGGGTAQAEFEALCGVPAMRELSGVEFDVFSGRRTFCLPNLLLKGGYHTMASNAFVPDFFNSINAYQGMGFEKSYYPKEYAPGRETYLSIGDVKDEKYMFDGDLFKQNLAFIAQWKDSNSGVPLFNYIMSIYGHTPNLINTAKRPKILDINSTIKDEQLERAVNQYYYRTEAIADFLNRIQTVDPKSLVILVGDHLPPLVYGPNTYQKLNYLAGEKDFMHITRILFFENGRAVHYDKIHHYDIPYLILNYITEGKYCRDHACDFKTHPIPTQKKDYREAYMTIMAQAMN